MNNVVVGRQISWDTKLGQALDPIEVMKALIVDANDNLPTGTHFKVVKPQPEYFGTEHKMAWITSPDWQKWPYDDDTWNKIDNPQWDPVNGYYVYGQFTVREEMGYE